VPKPRITEIGVGSSGKTIMKIISALAVAGLIAAGGVANVKAESPNSFARPYAQVTSPGSDVPRSAFFVGLGGSYNSLNFGTQSVYAVGTSNVYQNGILASTGSAAGPASIYMESQSNLGFAVQGGYFQNFSGSNWLWGAKFAYSYLGTTSTVRNALLPQSGSFTPTATNIPVSFTGNAVVSSYQTSIIQQVSFIPFIGRSFEKGFVYLGAGPTLSQIRTKLNGLVGFADITGTPSDISGAPVDFSSSSWVYGGAAVVGATYFFSPSLFLDVSYTAGITSNQVGNYSSPFYNPSSTNGSVTIGTLVGTSSGRVITQAVTATLNMAF
jgi:hypothetical protein